MLKKAMFFLKYGETGLFVFSKAFKVLRKKRKRSLKKLQISVLPKSKPLILKTSNFKRRFAGKAKWLRRMMIILAKRYF